MKLATWVGMIGWIALGAGACGSSKARVDAGARTDATTGADASAGMEASAGADTSGADVRADQQDARSGDGDGAVRACKNTPATPPPKACHSAAECKDLPPVMCCPGGTSCWPASACPLPSTACPSASSRLLCNVDTDCVPDGGGTRGTCVSMVMGCPQCEYRHCQYPPPPCTSSPDSCGTSARCQTDGTCKPLLCTEGVTCPTAYRCSVGSPRAGANGCEQIPCNDGWTCDENTRCTTPVGPNSHGCTTLTCQKDGDCDCGYCVNGSCASNLGGCVQAPQ